MPRQFRTKNLSVSLNPSSKLGQLTEKLDKPCNQKGELAVEADGKILVSARRSS
jgi:hypothetical protein